MENDWAGIAPASGPEPAGTQGYAAASLAAARALPHVLLASSLDAGWTSLLLEHHLGRQQEKAVQAPPTPDQGIVLATDGEHELACMVQGMWRTSRYRPGSGRLHAPGSGGQLRCKAIGGGGFRTVQVYLPSAFLLEAADHYRRAGQPPRQGALDAFAFRDDTLNQTIRAMLGALASGMPELYAQSAAQWLAVHLLSRHGALAGAGGDRPLAALSDRRLARVVDYMSAHLDASLSLEALAREAAISKFHFVRLFRDKTGSTPHAYLTQLRIAAARRMLASTDLAVAEVGRACGFGRASHFGAAFARATGATPSAFRQALRGQGADHAN